MQELVDPNHLPLPMDAALRMHLLVSGAPNNYGR
jgi:hypothetical protein